MNVPSKQPNDAFAPPSNADRDLMELLVSYLDGELSSEDSAAVEQRLASDPHVREKMRGLEEAWQLLDDLPRGSGSFDFSQTTVAMVAQSATRTLGAPNSRPHGWMPWVACAAAVGTVTLLSYLATARMLNEPEQAFLRDLPMIERVDMYRNIQDVQFLEDLVNDGLFGVEDDNV